MQRSGRCAGDLHAEARARLSVGGIVITDGDYRPGITIARHDHEAASICVVMAGSYQEGFGRHSRRVQAGSVIVHPAGEHHDEQHDPVQVRLLTIELSAALIEGLGREGRVVSEAWHRVDYSAATLGCGLRRELGGGDATSALAVESIVMEMLALLGSHRAADARGCAWPALVRDRLEERSATPGLNELAELAGVHPVYLARAFRRRFGCSIGTYARRLQVGRAALMLEDPDVPLAAVASDAGFADQSHMTRLVREHTGLTPGAWRRRAEARIG